MYPDMPLEEREKHLNDLEDERYRRVCEVITGTLDHDALNDQEQLVYQEISEWRKQRQQRIKTEQVFRRLNTPQRQSTLANNLIRMRDRGQISNDTLMLYGISGTLPARSEYSLLSPEERRKLWNDRLESRLGINWMELVDRPPSVVSEEEVDWIEEGF